MFKSKTQPLCRFCGKPISKVTQSYRFGPGPTYADGSDNRRAAVKPLNRAEAQRYINDGRIVSLRYHTPTELKFGDFVPTGEPRYIDQVSVWDGETYEDGFFCNGDHAKKFGYAAARNGQAMPAYNVALRKQHEGSKSGT